MMAVANLIFASARRAERSGMEVKMRAKGWIAIALAIAAAGGGTNILAGVMSDKQAEEVTKVVYAKGVTDTSTSSAETGTVKADETADYQIEKLNKKGFCIKKTKADISMRDAISRVVKKMQDVYGDRMQVKKVSEVDLDEIELYDDRYTNPDVKYRAYTGVILCEGNVGFSFSINSITGQVTELRKITNQIDAEYDDPIADERLTKQIQEKTAEYKKIAKKFLADNVTDRAVKHCRVTDGSYSSGAEGIRCKKCIATAICETEDGMLFWVQIDPKTNEVFGWNTMGFGE